MKKVLLTGICLLVPAILLAGCAFNKDNASKERAEASRNLGEAYMAEGNYTKALRELLQAEKMNPDDPYLQNDLGLTYLAKNDPKEAVDHFKQALKLNPDYSPARNNLGTAYIALEEWDQAVECFTLVKDDLLYATPYFPLTNLGYVYYRKKDYGTAEKYYKEALEMKPDFAKAFHGLGQVYLDSGRYEQAIGKLQHAVELAPKAAPIYLDLGRAYEKVNEYDKALDSYKKAAAVAHGTALAEQAEAAINNLHRLY